LPHKVQRRRARITRFMTSQRHSCPRCDGQIFLLWIDGRVVCAGCRLEHQSLRALAPRLAEEERADAASSRANS